MKLKQWLYGATALAMLAACSDKDIAPGGANENEPAFSSGTSYLGFTLELPQEASTRAEYDEKPDFGSYDNDNFEDGVTYEYSVHTAALLLFKGATEADAKFVGAYVMQPDQQFEAPNKDNITTSFQKAIKVPNKPDLDDGESFWGLALVNYNKDHFSISNGGLTLKNAFKYNEDGSLGEKGDISLKTYKADNATTFSDLRKYITDCDFQYSSDGNKGIFMTNAPLSNNKGTTTSSPITNLTIRTLTQLADNFKNTMEEALANPAGCIFVERAVAKVTCSEFPSKAMLFRSINNTDTKVEINIKSVKWMVDNQEGKSFIIRNTLRDHSYWSLRQSENKLYRFIGKTSMEKKADNTTTYEDPEVGNHNWYRTYWCIDPTYNVDKDPKFDLDGSTLKDRVADGNLIAFYPRENTFDVERQQYKNTTRAVFKVEYEYKVDGVAQNLYVIRDEGQTFYIPEDAENRLMGTVIGSLSLHDIIMDYKRDDLEKITYGKEDFNFDCGLATETEAAESEYIEKDDYILKTLEFTDEFINTNFRTLEQKDKNDIATRLNTVKNNSNKANNIEPLKNNTCYYVVYLKHFGDTYCPMPLRYDDTTKKWYDDWKGKTVEDVYKKDGVISNDDYLGRYGLVRNNWYDIAVNSITKLGSATIPDGEDDDTSDDNREDLNYLSAKIHVLSWAKRTQKVDF